MANLRRVIVLLTMIVAFASAKKYARRELARALLRHGISKNEIPMWICLATHESGLDSDAINRCNGDDSWDHGLWQINDRYWVGRDRRGGACGLAAWEVRGDNLENAIRCVQMIIAEHRRIPPYNPWMAWTVYSGQGHCQGDLSSYVEGCF